jgi:hypothetical protein
MADIILFYNMCGKEITYKMAAKTLGLCSKHFHEVTLDIKRQDRLYKQAQRDYDRA